MRGSPNAHWALKPFFFKKHKKIKHAVGNQWVFLASLEFVVEALAADTLDYFRSLQTGSLTSLQAPGGFAIETPFPPQESTPVRRSVFKIYNITHCGAFSGKKKNVSLQEA